MKKKTIIILIFSVLLSCVNPLTGISGDDAIDVPEPRIVIPKP